MRTEKGVVPRRGPAQRQRWMTDDHHHHFAKGLTTTSNYYLFWSILPILPFEFMGYLSWPLQPSILSLLWDPQPPPPPPSALRPCICRLPTNYFCLLSLLQPAPMTTVSCFWVLTTGGTQAKQVKWTRALTQFGSEGFLCHPLLAFYHPLSLHWNHKFASVGLWNPTGSCRRGHSNQTLQQILPS